MWEINPTGWATLMLALLVLQPPGFGTFAEPAPAVPGQRPYREARTSTDANDGAVFSIDT